jgi:hypothetical protein
MKTIKVWFIDFGINIPENFLIFKILNENYIVKIDSKPDYVFFSNTSNIYLNYDCVRIRYSGEQQSPDFDLVDYEIGFDDLSFGDRYIRMPQFMINDYGLNSYIFNLTELLKPKKLTNIDIKNRQFCSYLSSNHSQFANRNELVTFISQYKQVSSGGKINNNIGYKVIDKLKFISNFKFNIAAENSIYKGYTTEKIYEAFLAKTIPIYSGNPEIHRDFNPKSFIDLNQFKSYEDAMEFIIKLDQNDDLYLEMLNQPKILNVTDLPKIEDLETFLFNIFEQPLSAAKRRPLSQRSRQKANEVYFAYKLISLYKFIPKPFKKFIRLLSREIIK